MSQFIQVITTVDKKDVAEKIAASLVEMKLAGCVQILGPVVSRYHWQGNVEQAEEWQCIVKTRLELYDRVETAIKKIHPYEIPEIIAMPIITGSREYLAWLHEETGR